MFELTALIMLILFGVIGFAAIFFTTFGTLIILIGAIGYAFLTGLTIIGIKTLIVLGALYCIGELLEYVLIIGGAKKLGASNAAVVGALIGAIAGAFIGVRYFGSGIIAGTFIGLFFGAFAVELIIHRDLVKSLKAGAGTIIGRIGSIVAKVGIAAAMFWVISMQIMGR